MSGTFYTGLRDWYQRRAVRQLAGELTVQGVFLDASERAVLDGLERVLGAHCRVCPKVALSALTASMARDGRLSSGLPVHLVAPLVVDFVVCLRSTGEALCAVQLLAPGREPSELLGSIFEHGAVPLLVLDSSRTLAASDIRRELARLVEHRRSFR